jgi:hypothetical protein
MVEMGVEINWMKLPQKAAEFSGNPLRKGHWNPATDPDDFHMGNPTEFSQDISKFLVIEKQRITPREDDITDCRFGCYVPECCLSMPGCGFSITASNLTLSHTETTVHWAFVGNQPDNPVWIAVNKPGQRA